MNETKHTHSFSVDTSCECGIMLSDYTRSLSEINADLIAAAKAALSTIALIEAFPPGTSKAIKQSADLSKVTIVAAIQKAKVA